MGAEGGLAFSWSEFSWAIINFVVLLAILNKLLYKPVVNMLEERKATIKNSMEHAEVAKTEADKLRTEYAALLKDAKQEAQKIIADASKAGEDMREQIVTSAKGEAQKAIQKAQEEIAREKDQAIAALRGEIATLAVLAASKVVDKSISVADHEKMVKEFVAEVGELPC